MLDREAFSGLFFLSFLSEATDVEGRTDLCRYEASGKIPSFFLDSDQTGLVVGAVASGILVCGDVELRIQAEAFSDRNPGLDLCEKRQAVNGWLVLTRDPINGSGCRDHSLE